MILCEVCKKREAVCSLAIRDLATGKDDENGMGPNVCVPCGKGLTGSDPPYEELMPDFDPPTPWKPKGDEWEPHTEGKRVVDADGNYGRVVASIVTNAEIWGFVRSRRTEVLYESGRVETIPEFEDDRYPMLKPA